MKIRISNTRKLSKTTRCKFALSSAEEMLLKYNQLNDQNKKLVKEILFKLRLAELSDIKSGNELNN